MSHWKMRLGLIVSVFALALPTWAEETVDSVEKRLTEAVGKVKAFSYKMTMTSETKTGETVTKSDSAGGCDYAKDGAKIKFRNEMKSSMSMKGGGMDMKHDVSMLSVCDGEFAYTLSEMMGQKMAMKDKADFAKSGMDTKSTFDGMRLQYTLKLLPDAKVDGKDCYVIEGTAKEAADPTAKQVSYFAKDLGIMLKGVGFDKDGKEVSTLIVKDLKLDPTFPPDHFAFKAPEGVTVTDNTKAAKPGKE